MAENDDSKPVIGRRDLRRLILAVTAGMDGVSPEQLQDVGEWAANALQEAALVRLLIEGKVVIVGIEGQDEFRLCAVDTYPEEWQRKYAEARRKSDAIVSDP